MHCIFCHDKESNWIKWETVQKHQKLWNIELDQNYDSCISTCAFESLYENESIWLLSLLTPRYVGHLCADKHYIRKFKGNVTNLLQIRQSRIQNGNWIAGTKSGPTFKKHNFWLKVSLHLTYFLPVSQISKFAWLPKLWDTVISRVKIKV